MRRTCALELSVFAACACVLALAGCGGGDDDGTGTVATRAGGSGTGGSGSPPPVPGAHTPGASSSSAGSGGSGGSGVSGSGGAEMAGSGGAPSTGTGTGARDDTLDSLDDAGGRALCAQLNASFSAEITDSEAENLLCTLFAVVFTATPDEMGNFSIDRAMCEQQLAECLTSGGMVTSETRCDAAGFADTAAGCPLTVGQYTDCFEAQVMALAGLLDTVRCDAEATDSLLNSAAIGGDPASLPECAAFVAMCPDLVPSSAVTAPPEPPAADGCDETCDFPMDGDCDDGGSGSIDSLCGLGTDCSDCGPR